MATVMPRPAVTRPAFRWRIYLPAALACLVIALLGFWPRYFGPLILKGDLHPVPIIHLHAFVFTGWLILFITQAWLAASGRIATHMKIGRYLIWWGALILIVGWATAFDRFGARVALGDIEGAQRRLLAPLTDLLFFAPFLVAAWFYRRKPEIHKRLIIVATSTLLIAAVHRFVFFGTQPPPLPQLLALWLSPILLGMIYDFVKQRIVHPVYVIGIGAILIMKFARAWIFDTQAYQTFTRWLAGFYV